MQKLFLKACSVLSVSLSIHAMQTDQASSLLKSIDNQLATRAQNPDIANLAHHFTNPFPPISTLPALDNPNTAILLVNTTLVTLRHYDYPIDKLKVANNTFVSRRPKNYSRQTLQAEQAALDFVRSAVQELDKICRAWHQHYTPNRYDGSPQIPLANLMTYYALATQHMEQSLGVAQGAGHDALYIADSIQRHLSTLTLNKLPRNAEDTQPLGALVK